VPDSVVHFISFCMVRNGAVRVARRGVTEIQRKGVTVARGRERNGLWVIDARIYRENLPADCTALTTVGASPEEWHRRLGHVSYSTLARATEMTDGIKTTKADFIEKARGTDLCNDCMVGKQTRNTRAMDTLPKATERGERVHTDLCGPVEVEGPAGERYFMTFIDEATRLCLIETVERKSDAPAKLRELVDKYKSWGVNIKNIRCDGGGEFNSIELDEFYKERGINVEKTARYSPESNGMAERKNRTLMEMVRSMLTWAKLPDMFWTEAIVAANRLRNRLPVNGLDKTPMEAFFDKKPDLSTDKTFGCLVYLHVPKEKRKGKLMPRSEKGVMLYTYGEKGVMARVWRDGVFTDARDWACDENTPAWPDIYKEYPVPEEELERNFLIATTGRDWGPARRAPEPSTEVDVELDLPSDRPSSPVRSRRVSRTSGVRTTW